MLTLRFQRGQILQLLVVPASLPDACPLATITPEEGGAVVASFPVPYRGRGVFLKPYRIGPEFVLGTFLVTYLYLNAGVSTTTTETFEVVAGGDSGGEVISLYSYDRPEGQFVLAQLGGGVLVQGRNPHL